MQALHDIPNRQGRAVNISDPFSRVNSKRERHYQALRERLRQDGIHDAGAIAQLADNMWRMALKLAATALAVSLLLAVLLPSQFGVVMTLGVLALLWVAVSYVHTRMLVRRYLREECGGH